jgi:hypothetical protein
MHPDHRGPEARVRSSGSVRRKRLLSRWSSASSPRQWIGMKTDRRAPLTLPSYVRWLKTEVPERPVGSAASTALNVSRNRASAPGVADPEPVISRGKPPYI